MIILNQEQRLGRKAYLLICWHKLKAGLVILLIALVLLSLSGLLGRLIPGDVVTAGIFYVFALGVVVCVMSLVSARAEYNRYTFTFEEFSLKLKRGTFKILEVTIPYRQMQSVDVERGFLHQITGTSRVVINSAGQEEPDEKDETDIVLDPIDKTVAEEVRLMLQRKIGVQVVESEREADREAIASSA